MEDFDLSGETDPTERVIEQQAQAQERAEQGENERADDYEGEVSTDDYDVQEALSNL